RQGARSTQGDYPQGPLRGGPLEPGQSRPAARDKRSQSRSPVVGSAASTPGGPRAQRVRRRLRSDGERACGGTFRSGRLDVQCPWRTARKPRGKESAAGHVWTQGECGGRGPHVLWSEPLLLVPARGHIRGQNPQGRQARRLAGRAADEVRPGHQPQDRQGPRPDGSAVFTAAGGSGDSVTTGQDTALYTTTSSRGFKCFIHLSSNPPCSLNTAPTNLQW